MLKSLTYFAAIAGATLLFNTTAIAGLSGVNSTVRNTIQSPAFTGGSEDPFGDPQSTVVSSATEFPGFIDLYDINISDNSISFNWLNTGFSQAVGGPVGANVFDRNYFVFNLPENEVITSISFDAAASNLLAGSVEPSAQILGSNEVRTVFGEGVIRSVGFNPVFNITTATLAKPSVIVRNTIQSPSFTGGSEDPFGNAQSASISSATEFLGFIDLYDIDVTSDSITFNWIDTVFSQIVGGAVGADVFDRNYFVFNLPENVIITSVSFDAVASNLLAGSAEPTVQRISSNQVVTIFGEGVIRSVGFSPVFRLTTSTITSVPVMSPISLLLMSFGLTLMGFLTIRFQRKSTQR